MKITALTVCVNYGDFLRVSIQENKKFFDNWIVVTDLNDTETKQVCDEYNVTCVQTDVFYTDGAPFRKYKGINEGLKLIDDDSWIIFLDSDIILSPFSRRVFEKKEFRKDCIYGIDRLDCLGYERWEQYKARPTLIVDNWLMTNTGLPLGARIVHIYGEWGDEGKFTGYKPLGFFQMAHRSSFDQYPAESIDAGDGDIVFDKLWDENHRILIPEIMGIHLLTNNQTGINWKGRKSERFESKKKD